MQSRTSLSVWILVLFAIWVPVRTLALDPAASLDGYIVSHWDVEEGLAQNSIRVIVQTHDGYLWLGTGLGLSRFDGQTFTNFKSPTTPGFGGNIITSLAETADGSLWIGTSTGVTRYRAGRFVSYTRADGLKTETVNALCVAPDGSLWIGGRDGITRWVDGKFLNDIDTTGLDMQGMRDIAVDRRNTIWLAAGSNIFRYTDGTFTAFGPTAGLPGQGLQAIREDPDGRLLAVTQSGLFRFEGERFVPFEFSLQGNRVNAVLADRAGNLWIGMNGSLDRLAGGKVERYTNPANAIEGVHTLLEDREGCLWIGNNSGLHRLIDRRGYTLSRNDGILAALTMALRQTSDGSVWISSWAAGAARFQNGTVRQYRAGAPLSHESVTTIYEAPDGALWFGNRGSSLDRMIGDQITTFVYPPGVATSRPVTAIHVEPDGRILVGIAQRGLLELRDGRLSPYPGRPPTLANNVVWSIHRTRDKRLLLGTSTGIFQRAADDSWQPVALPGISEPVSIRALLEDEQGVIWLATDGRGLIRWERNASRAYGLREGMVDDSLSSVLDDGLGSLWVTSTRGIARIRRTELAELDRGAVPRLNPMTFGRVDGLATGATPPSSATPASVRLTDGRLMFATDKGAAVINPRNLQLNSQPPTVVIESAIADDVDLPIDPGQPISIPAGTNRLEIRYTALSLIAPHRLRFRYQLVGSDPTWVEAGRERNARYTHLAPGSYTFRVLACNNDGVWNTTGTTLAITVLPQFYQTLWFRLAAVVLFIAAGASLVSLRVRQLKLRQRTLARANAELDARVRERTAELSRSTAELQDTHKRLMEASRMAGMAEVATGVLHNVGNVLNSVNVSVTLLADGLRRSRVTGIAKITGLLQEHKHDLATFLTEDPKGQRVLPYIDTLAEHLTAEQQNFLGEVESLRANVEHIKEIVARQQAFTHLGGLTEEIRPAELVEDSLRMTEIGLTRHRIEVVRDFQPVPSIAAERHKGLQILINLVQNAKQAIAARDPAHRQVRVQLMRHGDFVRFVVADNGVGIPPENLTRIFEHGFTTRAEGHGFGLHSSANAAREMHGSLTAASPGPGQGATFTLDLPIAPPESRTPAGPGSVRVPAIAAGAQNRV